MILDYVSDVSVDISNKADLVGGKVPESQLPSYVDDVIEYYSLAPSAINDVPGDSNLANRTYWIYEAGSEYSFKFINTNANKTKDDWVIADPEQGKIYLNLTNNHAYRWTGDTLFDLDKNFSDRLNVIEGFTLYTSLGTVTDINDLSKSNVTQSSLKDLYDNTLNLTNSVFRRLVSISFSFDSKQYNYPIFDRDPVNKTFKVYNHGNLQTYKVLLNGNVYSMEKIQDIPGYVLVGDSASGIDNAPALTGFEVDEVKQAALVVGNRIIYGYIRRQTNTYYFAGFDGHYIRTYGFTEAGVASLYNTVSINNILNLLAYNNYGGKKPYAEFYETMAAQFTANTVVIDNALLNTTITDTKLIKKITTASYLVVTNVPNRNHPIIFIAGDNNSLYCYFFNFKYGDGSQMTYSRIVLDRNTNNISNLTQHSIKNIYNAYKIAGGTKTETEFYTKLTQLIDA